jgi:sugar phosphate isomerase/epimerase
MISRRDLLAGAGALVAGERLQGFRSRITKTRISAITDEIGRTQAEAIAFAHQYGLQWVELRNVPETKKEFAFLTEPELKRWAAELAANKLKVSFLNTSLLKFNWPGTASETPPTEAEQKKWENRRKDVESALLAANILGVDKVRVFTGRRVAKPEATFPLIVQTMEELIPLAEKAKVRLTIENEYSQNVATSAESKAIMDLLPSKWIGLNWDPENAYHLHEAPWPDGYAAAPKSRMLNVQFKARSVLDGSPDKFDWKSILEALQKDGYQGQIGLETHTPGDALIENAHQAMKIMLHMVGELS